MASSIFRLSAKSTWHNLFLWLLFCYFPLHPLIFLFCSWGLMWLHWAHPDNLLILRSVTLAPNPSLYQIPFAMLCTQALIAGDKDQGFKILSAMTARGKPPHSRQGSLKRTAPALSRVCRVAQVTVGTSFGFGVLGLNSDSSPLSLWLGFSAVDLKKLRLS